EIARLRFDDANVLENGFGNERSYRVLLAHVADRIEVIEIDAVYELLMLARNSGANGLEWVFTWRDPRAEFAQRRHEIAGDIVMPAIVAALHPYNVAPFCNCAGQP